MRRRRSSAVAINKILREKFFGSCGPRAPSSTACFASFKVNSIWLGVQLKLFFFFGKYTLDQNSSFLFKNSICRKVSLFTYTNNYSPLLGGSNFGFPASNRFFQGSNIYCPLLEKSTFIPFKLH